ARLLDHVGQRFHDLLLGVIDIAQRVHEQIIERLDISGKQTHGAMPFISSVTAGSTADKAGSSGRAWTARGRNARSPSPCDCLHWFLSRRVLTGGPGVRLGYVPDLTLRRVIAAVCTFGISLLPDREARP